MTVFTGNRTYELPEPMDVEPVRAVGTLVKSLDDVEFHSALPLEALLVAVGMKRSWDRGTPFHGVEKFIIASTYCSCESSCMTMRSCSCGLFIAKV